MSGTPADSAIARALILEPIELITSAFGPIQMRSASTTSFANDAFSERNPYPGWTASHSDSRAAEMIAAPSRYDGTVMALRLMACCEALSTSVVTPTTPCPSRCAVRAMRSAISPRFAMRIFMVLSSHPVHDARACGRFVLSCGE